MKMKHLKFIAVVMIGGLIFAGCKKEKDPQEEELITTLKVKLTEQGTFITRTFIFKDVDGPGGNPPTIDTITLAPNKVYNCELEVWDESKNPAEDITPEIRSEARDHQFYFEPAGVNLVVSNLDMDAGGLPLGISSRWTTGAASTGTIKITLKHKPGIKALGDPVTKGETDIEVLFQVRVQL